MRNHSYLHFMIPWPIWEPIRTCFFFNSLKKAGNCSGSITGDLPQQSHFPPVPPPAPSLRLQPLLEHQAQQCPAPSSAQWQRLTCCTTAPESSNHQSANPMYLYMPQKRAWAALFSPLPLGCAAHRYSLKVEMRHPGSPCYQVCGADEVPNIKFVYQIFLDF